jgi:hypothetical protein
VPLSLFLLFQVGDATAQSSDRDAILDVMEKAFEAVSSRNPGDWCAIQLAEGTTLASRALPDRRPDAFDLMRVSNNEEFIAALEPDGHDYAERWTETPTFMIRGPIAVIWGEYEFWIDGECSHCGVNSADLVKVGGEWKVASFVWTGGDRRLSNRTL